MKTTKAIGGWKKILAVGCSHGIYAVAAVLRFRDAFKPDKVVHLGDAVDMTALRSGAHGSNDEAAPILPDVDGGIKFLYQLRPNVFLNGNHEDRIFRDLHSSNAIRSYAAQQICNALHDTFKDIRCETVLPYDGIEQGITIGGFRYMHGVFYNENHCRDHAEAFGNVVFAHAHRAGVATGRRSDKPKGYCVGTLTRRASMDYAKARRATLGWSQAFVWGYYRDDQSQLWLHENNNPGEWLLPM